MINNEFSIKLGDYVVVPLNRENPNDPGAKLHSAFIRYCGREYRGEESSFVFYIGKHNPRKDVQEGLVYFHPESKKMIDYRIDTAGRRLKLRILEASLSEVKVIDLTERQTAVRD